MSFCFRGCLQQYKEDVAIITLIDSAGHSFTSEVEENSFRNYQLEEGDSFKCYVSGDEIVVEPIPAEEAGSDKMATRIKEILKAASDGAKS